MGLHHLLGRRLNDWRSVDNRRERERRLHLVDGRIVEFRIADHANEERSLLCERLFALAIEDFGQLVLLLFGFLQQFGGKLDNHLPRVVCKW